MLKGARLLFRSRGLATATRRTSKRLDGALSLENFLQRSRTLAFYRTILRGIKRIQDPTTKAESKKYARDEFERHRNVTDLSHIRYLLSTGKTEWETMERYIDHM
ncbi:unnamed protein product [Clonostachys chloroleuca]|uniref:LYR motif-containing protein 2 n=1 Tax=Clonostachys chloroleuca TaxID=1926264 RepID=A0AA35LV81_9HYPO|nr:unnamed protein product [Clonostachys chloroleuca]